MYELHTVPEAVVKVLRANDKRGVRKYPFSDMDVGQAFTIQKGHEVAKAKAAMRAYAARNDARFAVAHTDDGQHVSIVRIS